MIKSKIIKKSRIKSRRVKKSSVKSRRVKKSRIKSRRVKKSRIKSRRIKKSSVKSRRIKKSRKSILKSKILSLKKSKINKKYSYRFIEDNKENIYNGNNYIIQNIVNVLGPHSYEYYNILGKDIYLFGEVHLKPTCNIYNNYIPIDIFIYNIINANKSKSYDLFVEYEYRKREKDLITGVDFGKSAFFENCFKVEKVCPYKNVRGHYIDPRIMEKDIRDKHPYIMDSISYALYFYERNKIYQKYFQDITPENFRNIKEIFFDILNNTYKINKQYDNVESSLRNKILKFFNDKMDYYFNECKIATYTKLSIESKIICIKLYINAFNLIMDKYAIGRLFRTFKSIDMKNIIFYVGDSHRKHYTEIFNYLGYEPIYSNINNGLIKGQNCVQVDLNNF